MYNDASQLHSKLLTLTCPFTNLSNAAVSLLRVLPVLEERVGSMAMSCAELPLVEKLLVAASTSSSSSSASSPNERSLKFLKNGENN